jgi:hypothetical protein
LEEKPNLGDVAKEALDDYVEKVVERLPEERAPDPGNNCFGAVRLRKCCYVW